MSAKLPPGWIDIPLSDHVYIAGRIGWRGLKADEYTQAGPILLSVPNLNCGDEVNFRKVNHISKARYEESPEIQLRAGDTLLVKDGAGIGKLGFVATLPEPATVNSSLLVVRPANSLLVHKYLFYYLKGPALQNIAIQRISGSATPHLFQKDIKTFRVLIPPPTEQHRIVGKLDASLARIYNCQLRLANLRKTLKRFRQAVVASACSGRLTAGWRQSNGIIDSAKIIEALRKQRLAKSSTTAERDKLQAIFGDREEADSGDLPDGWSFVRLAKVANSFNYGTSAKSQPSGKVVVLRMGNLQEGRIDWSSLAYTSDSDEIKAYQLQPNTVLFNRTNSPELVGKTAIYRGEQPAIFAGYLIRINPTAELDPEYLNLCLNSPAAKDFCRSVKTDGVSQSNINAQKLGTFEVPFCQIDEQREIVRRVHDLFSFAARLEDRFKEGAAQIDGLTQSILAKAFRGELVPTEAELAEADSRTFESPEHLLQRIQQQKAASIIAKPKTRQKTVPAKAVRRG